MRKKIIGLAIASLIIGATFLIKSENFAVKAEESEKATETIDKGLEELEALFELGETDIDVEAQRVQPLNQEEYDDLIKSLPEGAELVDDVEVLPGVVK